MITFTHCIHSDRDCISYIYILQEGVHIQNFICYGTFCYIYSYFTHIFSLNLKRTGGRVNQNQGADGQIYENKRKIQNMLKGSDYQTFLKK